MYGEKNLFGSQDICICNFDRYLEHELQYSLSCETDLYLANKRQKNV